MLLCEPRNEAPDGPPGAVGGWRAARWGKTPSPAFPGSPAPPHRAPLAARSSSWKAFKGPTELLSAGPCLSQEPGWRAARRSELGAGRQESGSGAPPSQGLRFLLEASSPKTRAGGSQDPRG